MKIPKSFKLMGVVIDVEYDKLLGSREASRGVAEYSSNKIILQPKVEGNEVPKTVLEQVFFHELVHWICYKLGRDALRNDESFVESFSGLLHQALTTMEYDK